VILVVGASDEKGQSMLEIVTKCSDVSRRFAFNRAFIFAGLTAFSVLVGCTDLNSSVFGTEEPEPFSPSEASKIRDTAQSIAGGNASVLATCGPAAGRTYAVQGNAKLDQELVGWQNDKISGQFALVLDSNGKPDVIYSDSISGFTSANSQDGIVDYSKTPSSDIIFSVRYPSGSLFNYLVSGQSEAARGIVTSVKPQAEFLGVVPARGQLFVASCYRWEGGSR
jgi:hypothetical protein